MTTLRLANSEARKLYERLMADPDLIPPDGVSKEEVAWLEATQRVQQTRNNQKALELALDTEESSAVSKLNSFTKNMQLQKATSFGKDGEKYLTDLGYSESFITSLLNDYRDNVMPKAAVASIIDNKPPSYEDSQFKVNLEEWMSTQPGSGNEGSPMAAFAANAEKAYRKDPSSADTKSTSDVISATLNPTGRVPLGTPRPEDTGRAPLDTPSEGDSERAPLGVPREGDTGGRAPINQPITPPSEQDIVDAATAKKKASDEAKVAREKANATRATELAARKKAEEEANVARQTQASARKTEEEKANATREAELSARKVTQAEANVTRANELSDRKATEAEANATRAEELTTRQVEQAQSNVAKLQAAADRQVEQEKANIARAEQLAGRKETEAKAKEARRAEAATAGETPEEVADDAAVDAASDEASTEGRWATDDMENLWDAHEKGEKPEQFTDNEWDDIKGELDDYAESPGWDKDSEGTEARNNFTATVLQEMQPKSNFKITGSLDPETPVGRGQGSPEAAEKQGQAIAERPAARFAESDDDTSDMEEIDDWITSAVEGLVSTDPELNSEEVIRVAMKRQGELFDKHNDNYQAIVNELTPLVQAEREKNPKFMMEKTKRGAAVDRIKAPELPAGAISDSASVEEASDSTKNLDIDKLYAAIQANPDGFTLGQDGTDIGQLIRDADKAGTPHPYGRYMVSPDKERELRIPAGEITPETVKDFVAKHQDLLALPDHHVGGWLEDGELYLDVSRSMDDLEEAKKIGNDNSQLALFDALDMEPITLEASVSPVTEEAAAVSDDDIVDEEPAAPVSEEITPTSGEAESEEAETPLTPAQKAARTRAANKAAKEAEAAKAAETPEAKPEETPSVGEAPAEEETTDDPSSTPEEATAPSDEAPPAVEAPSAEEHSMEKHNEWAQAFFGDDWENEIATDADSKALYDSMHKLPAKELDKKLGVLESKRISTLEDKVSQARQKKQDKPEIDKHIEEIVARRHFDGDTDKAREHLEGENQNTDVQDTLNELNDKSLGELQKQLPKEKTEQAKRQKATEAESKDTEAQNTARNSRADNEAKYIADTHFNGDLDEAKDAIADDPGDRDAKVNDTLEELQNFSDTDLHTQMNKPKKLSDVTKAAKEAERAKAAAATQEMHSIASLPDDADSDEATEQYRKVVTHMHENPDLYYDKDTMEPATTPQAKQLWNKANSIIKDASDHGADKKQVQHEMNQSAKEGYKFGSDEHKYAVSNLNAHKEDAQNHYDHLVHSPGGKEARKQAFAEHQGSRLAFDEDGQPTKSIHSKDGKTVEAGPYENPHGITDKKHPHKLGKKGDDGEQLAPEMRIMSDTEKAEERIKQGLPPEGSTPPANIKDAQWDKDAHRWVSPGHMSSVQDGLKEGEGIYMPHGPHAGTDESGADEGLPGVVVTRDGMHNVHSMDMQADLGGHNAPGGSEIEGASEGDSTMSAANLRAHALGSALAGTKIKDADGKPINRIPMTAIQMEQAGMPTAAVKAAPTTPYGKAMAGAKAKGKKLGSAISRTKLFQDYMADAKRTFGGMQTDVAESLGSEMSIIPGSQALQSKLGARMQRGESYMGQKARQKLRADKKRKVESAKGMEAAAKTSTKQQLITERVKTEPEFQE